MKNYLKTIGATLAAFTIVNDNVMAEVEYTLGTGYSSEYLFRGANLGEDLIEATVSAST